MSKSWVKHLLLWVAYWALMTTLNSRYDGQWAKYAASEALQLPSRVLAAYLALWLFGRWSNFGRWALPLSLIVASVAGGVLNRVIKYWHIVPVYFPDSTIELWGYRFWYDVMDCLLVSGLVMAFGLYARQLLLQRQQAELLAEKTTAELHALKAQLQPHFLFNTIHGLYVLALEQSNQTAPMALKLANLLRFMLYETPKNTIPLEHELRIITNYIELEQLRFDPSRLRVDITSEVETPDTPIAPLLLLPLVENAFKHGASECRDNARVQVRLRQQGHQLDFEVVNTLPEQPEYISKHAGGSGLSNLRRRLELAYPHQARFETGAANGLFTATLHLTLTPRL
jgi:two-component system, LytTR family, sensor kinase